MFCWLDVKAEKLCIGSDWNQLSVVPKAIMLTVFKKPWKSLLQNAKKVKRCVVIKLYSTLKFNDQTAKTMAKNPTVSIF